MKPASPATWRVVPDVNSDSRLTRFLSASSKHAQIEMIAITELLERHGPNVSIAEHTNTAFRCRGTLVQLTFQVKEPGLILLLDAEPIAAQLSKPRARAWWRFGA